MALFLELRWLSTIAGTRMLTTWDKLSFNNWMIFCKDSRAYKLTLLLDSWSLALKASKTWKKGNQRDQKAGRWFLLQLNRTVWSSTQEKNTAKVYKSDSTNREYAIDDHVGVVLAVIHQLVNSLYPLSEVLWTQQTWDLLDVLSLICNTLRLRPTAVMTIWVPVEDTYVTYINITCPTFIELWMN